MHPLLKRLLRKRGIETTVELTSEEKATFDSWQAVLSRTETLTITELEEFCKDQCAKIEGVWRNMDNAELKNERLVIMHTVYKLMIEAINAPQKERQEVEKHLQTLLNT